MRSGYLLGALWIGFLACLGLVLTGAGNGDRAAALLLLMLAAGYGLAPATQSFARHRRRQRASKKVEKLAQDRRAPVVYLRSFQDDGSAPPVPALFYVLPILHPLGAVIARLSSYEEILAMQLDSVGPLVALEQPGQSLPELGATRVAAAERNWREMVEALLERSRLVIVRAGDTPNLLWELGRVVQRVPPEKLVIYLQMGREQDSGVQRARYNRFRREVADIFPRALPELPGRSSRYRFLFFGSGWEPRFAGRLTGVLKQKEIPYENPLRSWLKRILPYARVAYGEAEAGVGVRPAAAIGLRRELRGWELATAGVVVAALLGGLYGRLSLKTGTLSDAALLLLLTAATGVALGLIGRLGKLSGSGSHAAVGVLAALVFLYLAWASQAARPGALPSFDPGRIWPGAPRLPVEGGGESLPGRLELWVEAVVALGHISATAWAYGLSRLERANLERRER